MSHDLFESLRSPVYLQNREKTLSNITPSQKGHQLPNLEFLVMKILSFL